MFSNINDAFIDSAINNLTTEHDHLIKKFEVSNFHDDYVSLNCVDKLLKGFLKLKEIKVESEKNQIEVQQVLPEKQKPKKKKATKKTETTDGITHENLPIDATNTTPIKQLDSNYVDVNGNPITEQTVTVMCAPPPKEKEPRTTRKKALTKCLLVA